MTLTTLFTSPYTKILHSIVIVIGLFVALSFIKPAPAFACGPGENECNCQYAGGGYACLPGWQSCSCPGGGGNAVNPNNPPPAPPPAPPPTAQPTANPGTSTPTCKAETYNECCGPGTSRSVTRQCPVGNYIVGACNQTDSACGTPPAQPVSCPPGSFWYPPTQNCRKADDNTNNNVPPVSTPAPGVDPGTGGTGGTGGTTITYDEPTGGASCVGRDSSGYEIQGHHCNCKIGDQCSTNGPVFPAVGGGYCFQNSITCIGKTNAPGTINTGNSNMVCDPVTLICTIPAAVTACANATGTVYYCPEGLSGGKCLGSGQAIGREGNTVNLGTLAAGKSCGALQVDFDNPTVGAGTGGCGAATYVIGPPCTTAQQPQTTIPPQGTNPPSTNPPQTPTPPPFVCLSATKDIDNPRVGQSVRFTCGTVAGATSYEFRYQIVPSQTATGSGSLATDSGSLANSGSIETVTAGSNVTKPFPIVKAGSYKVQCRPCNGTQCVPFEAL